MNPALVRDMDTMSEKSIVDELGWDAFLRYKVASWYRCSPAFRERFNLLQFLGMTSEEYVDWVSYDRVADRVKRVWS